MVEHVRLAPFELCERYLRATFVVLVVAGCVEQVFPQNEAFHSFYYVAPSVSLNQRLGKFDFPGTDVSLDSLRHPALMGGIALGRRVDLNKRVRLHVGMSLEYGYAAQDTLWQFGYSTENKQWMDYFTRHTLFRIGIQPTVDIRLPFAGGIDPFICVGGGLNYVKFEEKLFQLDNPRLSASYKDHQESRLWRPHALAGFGFEIPLANELSASLAYNFRYWRPVSYKMDRNMPLEGIPYSETLLSHLIELKLVFGMER